MTEDFTAQKEQISKQLADKTSEIADFNNRLQVIRNQIKNLENNALSHDADNLPIFD